MKRDGGGGRGRGWLYSNDGLTLIEVMIAAMIVALGLTSVYLVGGQCMQMATSSHNSTLANQVAQEQTERLKGADFRTLLTSGSLRAFIADNPLISGNDLTGLRGLTNTVLISSYLGSGTAATTGTICVRNTILSSGSSSATILASGTLAASTIQLQVILGWIDRSGTHSRICSTLISRYE